MKDDISKMVGYTHSQKDPPNIYIFRALAPLRSSENASVNVSASSEALSPASTYEINVRFGAFWITVNSRTELNKIWNIEAPLDYFLIPIRKMKAFSAILILFFVAAALGLKLNVFSL